MSWNNYAPQHPVYFVYRGMMKRCHSPRDKAYGQYGGRGIVVCEEWRNDFWKFVSDMGPRPEGTTLDRIDNDGPYSPENCRWADMKTQSRNTRINVYIDAWGEKKLLVEWLEDPRCVVSASCLRQRITGGWDGESALSIPSQKSKSFI